MEIWTFGRVFSATCSNNLVHSSPITRTLERIYSLPFQYPSPPWVLSSLKRFGGLNGFFSPVWKLRLNHQLRRVWIRLQKREKIKALIWVVDANDHNRFVEGRDALKETLDAEDVLRGTPVLVLANKQDLPGAVNVTELAKALELQDIHGRPWHIMVCCDFHNIFARQ
jgi:ADP-ribosylation factor family